MSETANIAAALAKFQAEMPVVGKAHEAKVQTKGGQSYSYTYAGLADVSAAAIPILAKHGLAFSVLPGRTDRGLEVVGVLLHDSGETLTGSLPITGTTPQEIGSSLTYARRYLFGCMTGLVTDDDDDGRAASAPRRPAAKKAERVTAPPPDDRWQDSPPIDPLDQQISKKTNARMFALFAKKGPLDPAAQLAGVNRINGTAHTSRAQITERQGLATCAALAVRPDMDTGAAS